MITHMKQILAPRRKAGFLLAHAKEKANRILDIGCGNNSVNCVKSCCPDCYYIGIDVGDYNLGSNAKSLMDEYHVVSPEKFADKISDFKDSIDIVISAHNLEHCNEPWKVLENMILCLNDGGSLYLAFPSEESVHFPNREGTLNFYDDPTHIWCPEWNEILKFLVQHNIKVNYACKNYSPLILRTIGKFNEHKSNKKRKVLTGTWTYYGFESIIWCKK